MTSVNIQYVKVCAGGWTKSAHTQNAHKMIVIIISMSPLAQHKQRVGS